MQTLSPPAAPKSEPLGTYVATFPSPNGTAPWRLLDGLFMDVKSFMNGLKATPVTITLRPTPNSIVLSVSADPQPAPTSQASTLPVAPAALLLDASQRLYSWDEIERAMGKMWATLQLEVDQDYWTALGMLLGVLSAENPPLHQFGQASRSASNGASAGNSST